MAHNVIYPLLSVQNIIRSYMSLAKKISVLNTIVKYFYQRIIEANYNVDQYCNSLIWPNNFYTTQSPGGVLYKSCS